MNNEQLQERVQKARQKDHLIDLIGISKEYDGVKVLKDIDLYIRKKEFLTLLGPSGCGKTTTLRIIGGLRRPPPARCSSRARRSPTCRPTSAVSIPCSRSTRSSPT